MSPRKQPSTDSVIPWWARPWAGTPRGRVRTVTIRNTVSPILTTLLVVSAFTFAAWDRPYPSTRPGPALSIEHAQTTNALTTGCSGIYEFPHHPQTGPINRTREDGSPRSYTYAMRVPAFGPYFTEDPSGYPADRFRPATHADPLRPEEGLGLAFEHGWVIVWYDKNTPEVDVSNAVAWLDLNPDAKVVVAEWPEDRRPFPKGRHFGFTAQNVSQSCARFAGFTLNEFRAFTKAHHGTPTPDLPRRWEN